jgi:hypothetical protein
MNPFLSVFDLGFGGRRAARNCKNGDQYQNSFHCYPCSVPGSIARSGSIRLRMKRFEVPVLKKSISGTGLRA